MRAVRCSGRQEGVCLGVVVSALWGGGRVCLGVVSAWGVYTSLPRGQTDTYKNITLPQLLLRTVNISISLKVCCFFLYLGASTLNRDNINKMENCMYSQAQSKHILPLIEVSVMRLFVGKFRLTMVGCSPYRNPGSHLGDTQTRKHFQFMDFVKFWPSKIHALPKILTSGNCSSLKLHQDWMVWY